MAKTKISEYDSTAANNTDIDSINIAEGCAPSGINNAIRELMAHLKDMNIGSTITMLNTTEEDSDGGRANKIIFKGEQSGGEESVLGEIQASHDGTGDDQKGDLIFKTNDGSDGASPTERLRIDSDGLVTVSGSLDLGTTTDAATVSTTASDYQLQLGAAQSTTGDIGRNISFDISGTTTAAINTVDGGTSNAQALAFFTGNGSGISEAIRIDSSQKVGIGVTDPDATLDISGGTNKLGILRVVQRASGAAAYGLDVGLDASTGDPVFSRIVNDTVTEVMRIVRSSGDLLVGKTAANNTAAGHVLYTGGLQTVVKDGGTVQILNRLSSDGTIVDIRKDSSSIVTIANSGTAGMLILNKSSTSGIGIFGSTSSGGSLLPTNHTTTEDNAKDLGRSDVRWDDVHATNGTIQTSDENEKQNIASLTSAEITAATAIGKLFKTFKWKDKVATKGDNARTHTGVVAQEVEKAMSDAGLDAGNYAFFISTTWWETQTEVAAVEADEENGIEAQDAYTRTDTFETQEEAPEGATERNRKGIRYPELLSFIGAATEQRLTNIEARLDALEA